MHDETDITSLLADENYDEAVEAILALYGPRIFRMMVGVLRDESAAEDTFQHFSIVLWETLPNFRGESRVYTWTYTLARRSISRRLRKATSPEERLHTHQERELAARWTRTATAEWRKTESKNRLQDLLDDLPPEDRTLVMLRIAEALPWDEIAAIMAPEDEESEPATRTKEAARLRKRFERVKKRLQKALGD